MHTVEKMLNNTITLLPREQYRGIYDINSVKEPSFSVIIPCYNMGEMIERAVVSVLEQSLENVQIIIVDDASDDVDTMKKLKNLEKYADVIYVEKNHGVAYARNVGIKKARSQYILFLDSDDFIASTYLANAKQIFDHDERIGVVSCWVKRFGESEGTWLPSSNFSLAQLLAINKVPIASCVRKCVCEEAGYFGANLSGAEDWDFWIKVFSLKKKWEISIIEEFLFYYYVHNNSLQHSRSREQMIVLLERIFDRHAKKYKDHIRDVFCELHATYTLNRFLLNKRTSQVEELKKEITFLKTCKGSLKNQKQNLEKNHSSSSEEYQNLENKHSSLKRKYDNIIESKSFRIGNLFFRSIKKPYKLVTLPFNIIKILLEK